MQYDSLWWKSFWAWWGGILLCTDFLLVPACLCLFIVTDGGEASLPPLWVIIGLEVLGIPVAAWLSRMMTDVVALTAPKHRNHELKLSAKQGRKLILYGSPVGWIYLLLREVYRKLIQPLWLWIGGWLCLLFLSLKREEDEESQWH